MIRPLAALAALCATVLLPGCGVLGALSRPALDAYELRGNLPAERPGARTRLHVIVEPPTVGGALDTDRILIRPDRLAAQYLPDGRWTDPPAEMLQAALVREVDATGAFRYVGREPLGAGGDYALVTEITDFQAELVPGGGVRTHLRVLARLVREADVEVVATRVFEASVPAASTDTEPLVAALDRGMSDVVGRMAAWTVATLL